MVPTLQLSPGPDRVRAAKRDAARFRARFPQAANG